MARINEGPFPRPVSLKSAELMYLIDQAASELDARDLLVAESPMVYDRKIRDDFRVESMMVDGWYKCTVFYKAKPGGLPGGGGGGGISGIQFSTIGGSRLVQVSKETILAVPAAGKPSLDFGGAINVDEDGSIRGTQLPESVFTFQIPVRLSAEFLTDEVVAGYIAATNCTNHAVWKGFAKGEAYFDGAEGAQAGVESDVMFKFRARPNKSAVTIAGIPGVTHEGWHHVWIYYRTEKRSGATTETKVARQVNVERVFDYYDFGSFPV